MQQARRTSSSGFSLLEMMVATAAGLVLLASTVALFRQAVDLAWVVTQRAEMQQNARVAINMITRDVSIAATGMPSGGVQLPSGAGSVNSKFACDASGCYVTNNVYGASRLYAITPGDTKGSTVNGQATDAIVAVYRDPNSSLDQLPLKTISAAGDSVQFDAATNPPINDPAVGVAVGDVLVTCNINGCAAGVVTAVNATTRTVTFGSGDPLSVNQPLAACGNIKSLQSPAGSGTYPQSCAFRIQIVTYYIDASNPASPRLMRQVNAQRPVPVAENIENLQFSYDIFNDNTGAETSNLSDAGGTPNQIRKVNISVSARGPVQRLVGRGFDRLNLVTSVGPRNLAFRDRYQ
jgi:prepilin-type N-terminal cleavage/methylation domain-containing protein